MITVKEEFLTDDKTIRAIKMGGYEVLALWLAMKRYCALNLTDGFVPDEDIDTLPGAPPNTRAALDVLVNCGRRSPDGSREAGLVDPGEQGWWLHKYLEHANSREQEERRKELAKKRKDKWLERRASEPGTLPERRSETVPEGNGARSEPGLAGAGARTNPTQPNPTQPKRSDLSLSEPPPDLGVRSEPRAREGEPAESGTFRSPAAEESDPTEAPPPLTLAERARVWVGDVGERCDYQTASFVAPHPEKWAEVLSLERVRAEVFKARPQELRNATDERVLAVLRRLAEGYTPEQLESAVRGAGKDDLYQRKPQQQNLATILKSGANVDRFIALYEAPSPSVVTAPRGGDPNVHAKRFDRARQLREAEIAGGAK